MSQSELKKFPNKGMPLNVSIILKQHVPFILGRAHGTAANLHVELDLQVTQQKNVAVWVGEGSYRGFISLKESRKRQMNS